jgi:DNA-binding MarR family transcriptional regulator
MSLLYNNSRDSITQYQEHISGVEVETNLLRQSKTRRRERFLKGPIPFKDIAAAALLPGRCLALFIAVHHQIALTGRPIVTLPATLLRELGISRSAKARCLNALEQAGLVGVTRSKGRAARIELKNTKVEVSKCGRP